MMLPLIFTRRAYRSHAVLISLFLFFSNLTLDLDAAEAPGSAPLLDAVRTGDAVAWQALLKAKPDVSVRDTVGNTALHFAALNHDLAALNALLAAGAEVDA